MITLKKTDRYQIATNFGSWEFFSKSPGVTEHPFNKKLVDVAQAIRTYTKLPVLLLSTYRTYAHNKLVGGVEGSQHLYGNAEDLTIVKKVGDKYVFDPVGFKKLANELRIYKHNHPAIKHLGVGGIGIYDTFIHLDYGGSGRYWDEATNNFIGNNLEVGEKLTAWNFKNGLILLGITTLGVVAYHLNTTKKQK